MSNTHASANLGEMGGNFNLANLSLLGLNSIRAVVKAAFFESRRSRVRFRCGIPVSRNSMIILRKYLVLWEASLAET